MDDHLDSRLKSVASRAAHPGLRAIDVTILERIAHERTGRARALRLDALAFTGALAVGVASSIIFSTPPAGGPGLTFSGVSRLAPSSLLERGR